MAARACCDFKVRLAELETCFPCRPVDLECMTDAPEVHLPVPSCEEVVGLKQWWAGMEQAPLEPVNTVLSV